MRARVKAEAEFLLTRTLQRYCAQHDVITWRWLHRDCCGRARRDAAALFGRWL